MLEVSRLRKAFTSPEGVLSAVVDVEDFQVNERAHVALRGDSGSGKTTFLNLIAGILQPDAGRVAIQGQIISELNEASRDRLRATTIGYVFQTFNLLQGYTCLENVLLAMTFAGRADRPRAEALLRRVGLGQRLGHRPRQLSTGQQQRVAVARALANRPVLVVADEPTGNLDARNGSEVLELLRDTCRENEAALLLVSHDRDVLSQFDDVRDFHQINRACDVLTQ